jgi:hypothetical protein
LRAGLGERADVNDALCALTPPNLNPVRRHAKETRHTDSLRPTFLAPPRTFTALFSSTCNHAAAASLPSPSTAARLGEQNATNAHRDVHAWCADVQYMRAAHAWHGALMCNACMQRTHGCTAPAGKREIGGSHTETLRASVAAMSSPCASAPAGEKACAGATQPSSTAAKGSMLLVKPMPATCNTAAHRTPSVSLGAAAPSTTVLRSGRIAHEGQRGGAGVEGNAAGARPCSARPGCALGADPAPHAPHRPRAPHGASPLSPYRGAQHESSQ